jgi:hypothetical protein
MCSARILVTDLMEQGVFECSECLAAWSKDDMGHFAVGLSEFDVADVQEWILSRPETTHRVITAREQILLVGLETVLDMIQKAQTLEIVGVVSSALEASITGTIRQFGDTFEFKPKKQEVDWCEAQYQQEIESRQRERRC